VANLSRRNFVKAVGAMTAAAAIAPQVVPTKRALAQDTRAGKVVITNQGGINIHTYVAPADSAEVTSHLIETENSLVLVDAQFNPGYAAEIAAYAEASGKSIDRIYLSHEHQDHFSGISAFDAPFITTDVIAENVVASGALGDNHAPEGGVVAGSETIDGVEFEFDIINNAEAPEHLIIRIPAAGAVVAQDLVYSNSHAYPLGMNDGWIEALNGLRGLAGEGYNTILAGHGVPTSFGVLDTQIEYLNRLMEAIENSSDAEELIATMTEQYPSYGVQVILDLFAGFLFE